MTNLGKALGAYKMTLDCKDSMIPFYEGLGYGREAGNANTLSIRYPVTEAKLWKLSHIAAKAVVTSDVNVRWQVLEFAFHPSCVICSPFLHDFVTNLLLKGEGNVSQRIWIKRIIENLGWFIVSFGLTFKDHLFSQF